MAPTFTLWLNRLFLNDMSTTPPPASTAPKPMEIKIERLPDYLWRDLGFQQPGRRGGE